MAMLADRRERKRYNLVPRGKALYEDSNRFGTKMLEKMGWSKGKGLGPQENGDQEFVRIKYKNDSIGLGFEDKDDQWTQHENDFNGILKSLHNSEENSDADQNEEAPVVFGFGFKPKEEKIVSIKDKISGESLEEKSKKSRARVHYKKFTRGKDLSQYSEKDLANIFGKKSFDAGNISLTPEIVEEDKPEEEQAESHKFGITTINTGTSIKDYFKNKMANKQTISCNNVQTVSDNEHIEENEEEIVRKKSKKSKKEQHVEGNIKIAEIELDKTSENNQLVIPKKKKKAKKLPTETEDVKKSENKIVEEITLVEEVLPKKKKLKRFLDNNSENSSLVQLTNLETENDQSKKKKRKITDKVVIVEQKLISMNPVEDIPEENNVDQNNKKSKSKKCKIIVNEKDDISNTENLLKKSKKKKHKKEISSSSTNAIVNKLEGNKILDENPAENCSSLKKSKRKETESEEKIEISKTEQLSSTKNSSIQIETQSNSKVISKNKYEQKIVGTISLDKKKTLEKITEPMNNAEVVEEATEYKINKYVAEKFRHVNTDLFKGSNLKNIVGYSLTKNLNLTIYEAEMDNKRIADLWLTSTDKYGDRTRQKRAITDPNYRKKMNCFKVI